MRPLLTPSQSKRLTRSAQETRQSDAYGACFESAILLLGKASIPVEDTPQFRFIKERVRSRIFLPGTILLRSGEMPEVVYLLRAGDVSVHVEERGKDEYASGHDSEAQKLGRARGLLHRGAWVGGLDCLQGTCSRLTYVVASSDCVSALEIKFRDFLDGVAPLIGKAQWDSEMHMEMQWFYGRAPAKPATCNSIVCAMPAPAQPPAPRYTVPEKCRLACRPHITAVAVKSPPWLGWRAIQPGPPRDTQTDLKPPADEDSETDDASLTSTSDVEPVKRVADCLGRRYSSGRRHSFSSIRNDAAEKMAQAARTGSAVYVPSELNPRRGSLLPEPTTLDRLSLSSDGVSYESSESDASFAPAIDTHFQRDCSSASLFESMCMGSVWIPEPLTADDFNLTKEVEALKRRLEQKRLVVVDPTPAKAAPKRRQRRGPVRRIYSMATTTNLELDDDVASESASPRRPTSAPGVARARPKINSEATAVETVPLSARSRTMAAWHKGVAKMQVAAADTAKGAKIRRDILGGELSQGLPCDAPAKAKSPPALLRPRPASAGGVVGHAVFGRRTRPARKT